MQSLDEVARGAMGGNVFRVTRYGNTSRIPGEANFSRARGHDIKVRQDGEGDARSNTIVSRQVSAKWRLFGIHKRISRISRRSNVTNPDLCVSRFVIRPLSALCGATGERYLVFRSWTTADVPQRSCVPSSRSFAPSRGCKLPNRRSSEKKSFSPLRFPSIHRK